MSGLPAGPLRCPACDKRRGRAVVVSRRSGRVAAACDACGCHWLANPPSASQILDNHAWDRGSYEAYVSAKHADRGERDHQLALRQLNRLIASGGRSLLDVGAGAGEFLVRAGLDGFEAHGNEIAPGAIEMARERTGIELHSGELATIEGADRYDAVTMWCVIAHVAEPDALLRDALRLLKPGGILFVQTPRWSAMDTVALFAARVSRGRLVRVLDQRLTEGHMTLNSRRSLTAHVTRLGFEVADIRSRASYTLEMREYLRRLGLPRPVTNLAARILDIAAERNLFVRNVLTLYARKPIE